MNVDPRYCADHINDVQEGLFTKFKGFFATLGDHGRLFGRVMPKLVELKVHLARDDESGRWYIAESDIPGLRVEAATADELIKAVSDVAPDLIELNIEEIMAAEGAKKRTTVKKGRPRLAVRPVFDSPMALAC